jgi:hypothetical protein
MSSNKRVASAIAVAVLACFGCAHRTQSEASVAKKTTTTTVVAQPVPTAIGGGPPTHTPERLDAERASRLVDARTEQFRNDCYSADRGPVSFMIEAEIEPSGHVRRAEILTSNGAPEVADCVLERINKMTLPQTLEGGRHTFSFLFGQ